MVSHLYHCGHFGRMIAVGCSVHCRMLSGCPGRCGMPSGCPGCCGMLSSIPGLCPLDAEAPPCPDNQKYLHTLHMSLPGELKGGQTNLPLLENYWGKSWDFYINFKTFHLETGGRIIDYDWDLYSSRVFSISIINCMGF